jgi:hypothetical protein
MKGLETTTVEFSDPAFVDLVERYGVQVMIFLPSSPNSGYQVGLLE